MKGGKVEVEKEDPWQRQRPHDDEQHEEEPGKKGKNQIMNGLMLHWKFPKLCPYMEKVWRGE